MFSWLRRCYNKKLIKTCIRKLSYHLVRRYGRQSSYTYAQITKTIDACKLSYLAKYHALVCFGDEVEIKKYFEEEVQQANYDEIYLDVKLNYLNGAEPSSALSYGNNDYGGTDSTNSGSDSE
ncbi:DUF6559 family protein [Ostreibacterium oceani]|uniref:DUF6559 family protein n=1 Tax=Ostreibacterium oceani TaxID=2654998 RepID=UPI001C406A67|nr:DUF6559 family protein [Ostreibacterium oceani]